MNNAKRGADPTTRERMAALFKDGPISCADAATSLGVSRQRAWQIARVLGLTFGRAHLSTRQATPRMITGGIPIPLHATAAGTVAELLVTADLAARGWQPFLPVIRRSERCDIIVLSQDGSVVLRIEVRSGRRVGERISYNRKVTATYDHMALVMTGETIHYEPPLP